MSKLRFGVTLSSLRLIVLLAVCLLSSCKCGREPPLRMEMEVPGLPTRVDGTSDCKVFPMQKRLRNRGVTIINMGQNYLISIPSFLLFPKQSPRINWKAYGLLNDVACYIKQFRKVSINVTAYSSKYISPRREHALTLARAKNTARYLWSQGVDSRLMFTHGAGSDKPISSAEHDGDMSPNSRVEITFQDTMV